MDVNGGRDDLQAAPPQEPFPGGQPGGQGGAPQALVGTVVVHQQGPAPGAGDQNTTEVNS